MTSSELPFLPVLPVELAAALSRPFAGRSDGLVLQIVPDPELVRSRGETGIALRLHLTAAASDRVAQSWRLDIPVDRSDLDPAVDISAFITIIRANLQEW